MEQPEDRADRGAGDAAAGSPRRAAGGDGTIQGHRIAGFWVDEASHFSQRLYDACFKLEPSEAAPRTGARGCPACPEPEEYDAYIDWLRVHE